MILDITMLICDTCGITESYVKPANAINHHNWYVNKDGVFCKKCSTNHKGGLLKTSVMNNQISGLLKDKIDELSKNKPKDKPVFIKNMLKAK